MEIKVHEITVRDVFDGYENNEETGQVVAFGGKLNVRPAYQREFVYDEKKKKAVMNSILHQFPLNVMYWSDNGDGTYEMLDGQQRTISICEWLDNGYSVFANPASPLTPYYAHTSKEITNKVLDYKLMVYICKGTDTEKLDWFKIINIAGEKLTDQELRNAIYTGAWLSDAKKYFSKNQCVAYKIGERYMSGSPIRQDYLETVLFWISSAEGKTIEEYMAEHQHDTHATPLKQYYKSVMDWVELTFPKYRAKLMKGLEWGLLYNEYGKNVYDPGALEADIAELLKDDDVTKQKGVYEKKRRFPSVSSQRTNGERCTSVKAAFARCAEQRARKSIGRSRKCTPTTSYPGARAVIPRSTTDKCFAEITTSAKPLLKKTQQKDRRDCDGLFV